MSLLLGRERWLAQRLFERAAAARAFVGSRVVDGRVLLQTPAPPDAARGYRSCLVPGCGRPLDPDERVTGTHRGCALLWRLFLLGFEL